MAFKRTDFSRLTNTKKEYFENSYRFSKVVGGLKAGYEYYVLFLGLDTGYYETPIHTVRSQKINGQVVSLTGNNFESTTIKCQGINENGERVPSLCCELAKKERERTDSANRIISGTTFKVHIPVLILGNSLAEPKTAYPVSKVSILNTLNSDQGLKFAYIEMASSSFRTKIIGAYGRKLKEEGLIEYDISDDTPEFVDMVRKHLINTVVKITGVYKEGFNATLSDYTFFPFSNPTVGSLSPQGEREAILNYRKNPQIMVKVNEFLTLFNVEVDNIIRPRSDKDLQEYYEMALKNQGIDVSNSTETVASQQVVEVIQPVQPSAHVAGQLSAEEIAKLDDDLKQSSSDIILGENEIPLEEDLIEFDTETEDSFFG